ncbi:MAG: protein-disulfide reductase DsbD domain-containing protein [Myxococcota bacterium]
MLLPLFALVGCDWFTYQPEAPPTPEPDAPVRVTRLDGTVQPVPDPDHVLIIEAVRSLDWCVYCVAQTRAWQGVLARVDALDARLLVLSPDAPEVLQKVAAKRGFPPSRIAHVSPETFARLGVPAEPRRPELPRTTTLVIDEAGHELLRFSDTDYRARVDPQVTLDQITLGEGLPLPEQPAAPSPDWDGAATIGLVREGDVLALDVVLLPGFHVYGANETTSIPLSLELDDGTAAVVPPGEMTVQSGVETWLLEGAVRILVAAAPDEEVRGEVGWQLCNDRSCSAPRHERFALAPEEGRIIRPSE